MRNTKLTLCAFAASLLFFLPSCGGGDEAHSEDDGHDHAAHGEDDGHDHGAEENAGHSEDDEHEHGGEVHELGSVAAAGTTLSVTTGHVEAGAEVNVELELSSGAVPAGIRVWVGLESGVGSLKVKADPHEEHFHAQVEIPDELSPESRLWVQVESASGETETSSLALPKEDHED